MKLFHQENPNIQIQERMTLDFPQHLHDVLEIVFLHAGTAVAVAGGRRYGLEAGDVFVSFPNQPHGYENSRGAQGDVVIIPTTFLSPWRSLVTQNIPTHPVLRKGTWEHTGIAGLLDMIRPERRQLDAPVLQGYAMVVAGKLLPLLELTEQTPENSDAMGNLMRYISQHYREPISRKELSRAAGYNESYISHLFADHLGTTLKAYITSLRLKDARQMLSDTELTVSQISLMLGFGSIRSFNRAFFREFGTSPTAYRKGAEITGTDGISESMDK